MLREYAFVRQNKEKWTEIEKGLTEFDQRPASVWADDYVRLMNDLAFARTQYPDSSTTAYLNQLASQLHMRLHRIKPQSPNRLLHFFTDEVPQLAYAYRRYLLYAFSLFVVSALLGVFSCAQNPDFVRLILGDDYIHQTLENIERGTPLAVYGSGSTWGSFLGITANNMLVGLRMFASGIFAGLGTFWILFQNSLMVGTFQYFFIQKGLFVESARGIWLHGAFEISAMIIEGACGLILGASWLFPGTYSRGEAFKKGMKNSLKLFLSTLPFTLVAGFIEGFMTRHASQMPLWLCWLLIGICFATIIFYYVIYPPLYHKKLHPYANISTL